MKKIYSQPELELLVLTEDIVSTSGTHSYNGFGDDVDESKIQNWGW